MKKKLKDSNNFWQTIDFESQNFAKFCKLLLNWLQDLHFLISLLLILGLKEGGTKAW